VFGLLQKGFGARAPWKSLRRASEPVSRVVCPVSEYRGDAWASWYVDLCLGSELVACFCRLFFAVGVVSCARVSPGCVRCVLCWCDGRGRVVVQDSSWAACCGGVSFVERVCVPVVS